MTKGWCDSICLFILQVFTAFSQTAACSALSVVTAKNTPRTDVSEASTWTHMGRISFLKFQRKDFTWEESEAITAPFLSKCDSYRKQRKQVPISSGIFPMGRLVCTLNDLTTTREQRNKEHEQKFSPFPHCRTQWKQLLNKKVVRLTGLLERKKYTLGSSLLENFVSRKWKSMIELGNLYIFSCISQK